MLPPFLILFTSPPPFFGLTRDISDLPPPRHHARSCRFCLALLSLAHQLFPSILDWNSFCSLVLSSDLPGRLPLYTFCLSRRSYAFAQSLFQPPPNPPSPSQFFFSRLRPGLFVPFFSPPQGGTTPTSLNSGKLGLQMLTFPPPRFRFPSARPGILSFCLFLSRLSFFCFRAGIFPPLPWRTKSHVPAGGDRFFSSGPFFHLGGQFQ